ncbi:DUF2800 domain-containing protein [Candidatus Pseudoruminococcus sp.]|uniref:DUF2800 domain-containing protein n=1 Tax=Candidatus Pseudoruminococcus sp. TaxID=3101048 RepID=UPI003999D76A
MPDIHALLSASSSKQWLHCTPSARLQEQFPNESSVYAAEGTFAHEVCEYKVKKYMKERVKRPQSEEYYTEEIDQITDVYAEFVISVIEDMKRNGCEPLVMVEEKVDYSHIAPSGFGTADMLIIGRDENGKGVLHIADFKTGQGVFVDADHNSQMMLYALGGLAAYGYIYDIEIVRMSIIQPRLDNISTFECTREELESWGESIRETAKLAYEGKGEQMPGDWCRFCRAKPVCKACKDEALSLCREEFIDLDEGALSDEESVSSKVDVSEPVFKQPGLIPISELAQLLPTLNRISSWIESVFAFISSEAINHGVPIPGYKVVEGRSKRVFTDTKAVVDAAVANGYTDLYKKQLITLTEFEKMMGKKKFAELLGKYVTKPPGKLSLVPESDPREAVELNSSPEQEFAALPDEGE